MLENVMTGETSSALSKEQLLGRIRDGYNMFASLLRGIRRRRLPGCMQRFR